jgi:hypothetical protein
MHGSLFADLLLPQSASLISVTCALVAADSNIRPWVLQSSLVVENEFWVIFFLSSTPPRLLAPNRPIIYGHNFSCAFWNLSVSHPNSYSVHFYDLCTNDSDMSHFIYQSCKFLTCNMWSFKYFHLSILQISNMSLFIFFLFSCKCDRSFAASFF